MPRICHDHDSRVSERNPLALLPTSQGFHLHPKRHFQLHGKAMLQLHWVMMQVANPLK